MHPSTHPCIHASMHPCTHASIHPSIHPSILPSFHPSILPSFHLSIHLSLFAGPTSKSGLRLSVCNTSDTSRFNSVHFFAIQGASHYNTLNFSNKWPPKCSENGVLSPSWLRFWLRHVLGTIARCTFSTSQVSPSKSTPNLRCSDQIGFKICFAPQLHAILIFSSDQMAPKRECVSVRDFPTFSRTWIFCLLTLSLLTPSLLWLLSPPVLHLSMSRKFDFKTSVDYD